MEMWLVGSIDMHVRPLAMQDKIEGEKERVSWGPLYPFPKFIYLNSCVLVTQSCLSLCNPMDSRLPGSSIREILQASILEWVAIPFSRGSSPPRDQTWVSCIAGILLREVAGGCARGTQRDPQVSGRRLWEPRSMA